MTLCSLAALVPLLLASGPERRAAAVAAVEGNPSGSVARPSDAELAELVRALTSTIDTPIPPSRWRGLGVQAVPLLQALAEDPREFPTRRARALGGLAALGGPEATTSLSRLAAREDEPIVVRMAAVRGLGALMTPEPTPALQALLERAHDARVRAVAGEVLAQRSGGGGCAHVLAQLRREGAQGRARFHRAAAACATRGANPVDADVSPRGSQEPEAH